MALRGRLVTITLAPMRSAVCRHVAIPQSSRVEIELQWTRRGRQVSFGRHECAQRQNALAQAKLGRSNALIEPAIGWAGISRNRREDQGAVGAS